LSKETINAIKKAAGKQGSKLIGWAFKGHAMALMDKRLVRGIRFDDEADDEEEAEEAGGGTATSTSAAMGQGSSNHHA